MSRLLAAVGADIRECARQNDLPYRVNDLPYGRSGKGRPVVIDVFSHEEIRKR